jgi:hypothetical protein
MLALGFSIPQMVELVRAGFASASERVVAGDNTIEARITEAGRRALAGRAQADKCTAFGVNLTHLGLSSAILLLATTALAAPILSANARDDRLPSKFVGNRCLADNTADHLAFYRRGRRTNPDNVDDWLTISHEGFHAHEMHCKDSKLLVFAIR